MQGHYLNQIILRQQIYVYLSNSYAYPEDNLITAVYSGTYFNELAQMAYGLEITMPENWVSSNESALSEEEAADLLRTEYTRLFINTPASNLLVPPYESCYINRLGLVMDQDTIRDIDRFYQSSGLYLPDDTDILPDHIAVELEFMSYLLELEHGYRTRGMEKEALNIFRVQKAFLTRHLLTWTPAMMARIAEYAETPFYRGLADFTEIFLSYEAECTQRILDIGEEKEV